MVRLGYDPCQDGRHSNGDLRPFGENQPRN